MNYTICSVRENPDLQERAVDWFSTRGWGASRDVFNDCISNSMAAENPLPKWYLMFDNDKIIGGYGLIVNDFISRQDIWPWFAALFIDENYRGQALGSKLLEHGRSEASELGFSKLYLCTDHIGFYEKYGWSFLATGYGVSGNPHRIYTANTAE